MDSQIINIEGILEPENYQFATMTSLIDSGKDYQWLLKPSSKVWWTE